MFIECENPHYWYPETQFDPLYWRRRELVRKLTERYGKPSYGRNRATFLSKHCVIKVAINERGDIDNSWECTHWKLQPFYNRSKRILIDGIECVLAYRLSPSKITLMSTDIPDWVKLIDCYQVGYDKKGRLKAYDFGIE